MMRGLFFALPAIAIAAGTAVQADDADAKAHKDQHKATIVSVDAKAGTIDVKMKGDDGKKTEKTLHLADKAATVNSSDQPIKMDALHAGDRVVFTEKDGKVSWIKKRSAEAKITAVDAKKGTVTVSMTDDNGKHVDRTFTLVEDSEYLDSDGNVARVDLFRSGDEVLVVEQDGKIKEMAKSDAHSKSASKSKSDSGKKSG